MHFDLASRQHSFFNVFTNTTLGLYHVAIYTLYQYHIMCRNSANQYNIEQFAVVFMQYIVSEHYLSRIRILGVAPNYDKLAGVPL